MKRIWIFMLSIVGVLLLCCQGCSLQAPQLYFELEKLIENPLEDIIPIAVIGSGPAGLSAALYGARASIATVVFTGDKPGGLLTETTEVENWPGVTAKQGPAIMELVQNQAEGFGAQIVHQTVELVDFNSWPFTLQLNDGTIVHPLAVVIATGASPKQLGVSGEKEYWGKGVTACAVCDAPFFKGEEVVVVGGGDSAAEEAMQLAKYASKVTILVRKGAMRASPSMQKLLKGYSNITTVYHVEVQEIMGDGQKVTGVRLLNNQDTTLKDFTTSGVFLAIGHIPNTSLVKDAVKTDKNGYISVSCPSRRTSVPGVFAAGDAEDYHYRQAGVASGDGIKAGMDAIEFLTNLGYTDTRQKELARSLYSAKKYRKLVLAHIHTVAELNELLARNQIVLVDFYSLNCPPCMSMLPLFERVAAQYEDRALFVKITIDEANDLVPYYEVLSVPTLLVFKEGELQARITTPLNQQELEELVASVL